MLLLALTAALEKVQADEGLWLPMRLELNRADMQRLGLKIPVKDIYNADKPSVSSAVVRFGSGCTGEVVSPDGLVLTNHHCGYGAIQALSSVARDFLKNGFWAMERGEEIPAPGLTVTFIRGMRDVTAQVLEMVPDSAAESVRNALIGRNIDKTVEQEKGKGHGLDVEVKAFYGGNRYILLLTEKFGDIRLVGTPPSSIGKFGGDTDNWMWPRHTGDFSVFRIYASPENKPAVYAKENVPYKAPAHLKVSLKGYRQGDYAMIMGFPATTIRYLTASQVERMTEVDNPIRIFVRGERQKIWQEDMRSDPKVRIQYAAKYQGSSNGWKKAMGIDQGVMKYGLIERKEKDEWRFKQWVNDYLERRDRYGKVLPDIEREMSDSRLYRRVSVYYTEAAIRGLELVELAKKGLQRADSADWDKAREELDKTYKDYNPQTDRQVAKRMVRILRDSLPQAAWPEFFQDQEAWYDRRLDEYIDRVFDQSIYASRERYEEFLKNPSVEAAQEDPGALFSQAIRHTFDRYDAPLQAVSGKVDKWHRLYIEGRMATQADGKIYPDANSTMRLTYGRVLPYVPGDGVHYDYYTTLKGVIEKEDRSNPEEFTVPEKLKELYKAGNYGAYGRDGELRVCFLTDNDITGGNSGSPVLNAHGEMIGLAFDSNWEGVAGDISFLPGAQRTICVDIAYVLFVIDKFAGAGHLINEMTITK